MNQVSSLALLTTSQMNLFSTTASLLQPKQRPLGLREIVEHTALFSAFDQLMEKWTETAGDYARLRGPARRVSTR